MRTLYFRRGRLVNAEIRWAIQGVRHRSKALVPGASSVHSICRYSALSGAHDISGNVDQLECVGLYTMGKELPLCPTNKVVGVVSIVR